LRQNITYNHKKLPENYKISDCLPNDEAVSLFLNKSSVSKNFSERKKFHGVVEVQRVTPEELKENFNLLSEFEDSLVVWDTEDPPTSLNIVAVCPSSLFPLLSSLFLLPSSLFLLSSPLFLLLLLTLY
jgi:hypothetical protein